MNPRTGNALARLHTAELLRRSARPWPDAGRKRRRLSWRVTKERPRATHSTDFFAWVRSLPWVVERPYELAPGVRTFAVDCPPLAIRRLWLVTGLEPSSTAAPQLSVIVPVEVSWEIDNAGWGTHVAKLSAGHVLMSAPAHEGGAVDVEALVLTAYRHAMA